MIASLGIKTNEIREFADVNDLVKYAKNIDPRYYYLKYMEGHQFVKTP